MKPIGTNASGFGPKETRVYVKETDTLILELSVAVPDATAFADIAGADCVVMDPVPPRKVKLPELGAVTTS
jgi:hypothetical protein